MGINNWNYGERKKKKKEITKQAKDSDDITTNSDLDIKANASVYSNEIGVIKESYDFKQFMTVQMKAAAMEIQQLRKEQEKKEKQGKQVNEVKLDILHYLPYFKNNIIEAVEYTRKENAIARNNPQIVDLAIAQIQGATEQPKPIS